MARSTIDCGGGIWWRCRILALPDPCNVALEEAAINRVAMNSTVQVAQVVCPLGKYSVNNKGSIPASGSLAPTICFISKREYRTPHLLALSIALAARNLIIRAGDALFLEDEIVESGDAVLVQIFKLLPHGLDVILAK